VTRIFAILALFAVMFVAATLLLGLSLGDIRTDRSLDTQRWATVHRLSGITAGFLIVLVNSIVVTYFIGTSRWVKEVVETYRLDTNFIRRSTALKRRTFPWAVAAMLVIVGVVALGGAADPGAHPGSEQWTQPHLIGSILGLAFIAWASVAEWNRIYANHQVIEEVMNEVRRVRAERGLDVQQ
jgi:hypothetical protein